MSVVILDLHLFSYVLDVENDCSELLDLVLALLVLLGAIVDCCPIVQKLLAVLNATLQHLEVFVRVLLQLVDPHRELIVLFEDHSLNEFLLLLQPSLQVVVKLINLSVDLCLQFLKVFLDCRKPSLMILPVGLSVLQVAFELLS